MQQQIIIVTILIAVSTLIAYPLLATSVNAQTPPWGGVTGKTVILYDNPEGHSRGWNPNHVPEVPDSGEYSFQIFDVDFNPFTSTVLVSASGEGCHVPSNHPAFPHPAGMFTVECHSRIFEGSSLHYTLFNPICLLPPNSVECVGIDPTEHEQALKSSKNITQGIEGPLSTEQQGLLANVTGADSR